MLVARMLRLVPLFLVALCAAMASEAHASGPVSLRWSAPEDCPTTEEVLNEVNRLLGPRATPDEPAINVIANVKRKDDGMYVVRLEIPGADGPRLREVSAVSCLALGQATALIVAMMVDPEAALAAPPAPEPLPAETLPRQTETNKAGPGQTTPIPEPSTTPTVSPPLVDTSPRVPSPKRFEVDPLMRKSVVTRLQRSFSLHLLDDVGSFPSPALGFGGAVGIFPGRWRFAIGAAYFLEKKGYFLALPAAGSHVNRWTIHTTGGVAIKLGPKIEFTPRIRFEVGRFHASSFGVSSTGEGSATSFGVGIGGLLSGQVARTTRIGIGLDGVAFLAYPRFIVTGLGIAHEPSKVVGRLALEAEVRF